MIKPEEFERVIRNYKGQKEQLDGWICLGLHNNYKELCNNLKLTNIPDIDKKSHCICGVQIKYNWVVTNCNGYANILGRCCICKFKLPVSCRKCFESYSLSIKRAEIMSYKSEKIDLDGLCDKCCNIEKIIQKKLREESKKMKCPRCDKLGKKRTKRTKVVILAENILFNLSEVDITDYCNDCQVKLEYERSIEIDRLQKRKKEEEFKKIEKERNERIKKQIQEKRCMLIKEISKRITFIINTDNFKCMNQNLKLFFIDYYLDNIQMLGEITKDNFEINLSELL